MRINIYSEEITNETELIRKVANGNVFYGVRIYLKSPTDLHNDPEDDDRNAVTFWFNANEQNRAKSVLAYLHDETLSINWETEEQHKRNPYGCTDPENCPWHGPNRTR